MKELMVGSAHPDQLAPLARLDWVAGEGGELDLAAGSYNRLIWKGKQVGLILRTRKGIKLLYVSPGHRITGPKCLEITASPDTGFPSRRLRA